MTTAGGRVFFGDDAEWFEAVDARSGDRCGISILGKPMRASPMTYAVDGNQYVAIAAGSDVFSFGLE